MGRGQPGQPGLLYGHRRVPPPRVLLPQELPPVSFRNTENLLERLGAEGIASGPHGNMWHLPGGSEMWIFPFDSDYEVTSALLTDPKAYSELNDPDLDGLWLLMLWPGNAESLLALSDGPWRLSHRQIKDEASEARILRHYLPQAPRRSFNQLLHQPYWREQMGRIGWSDVMAACQLGTLKSR